MTLEIATMKQIELLAYPTSMLRFQAFTSWSDMATFAGCQLAQLNIVGDENYYFIVSFSGNKATCVDIAKKPSLAGFPWCDLMAPLRTNHISEIKMNLRLAEYNTLKFLASRVNYEVLADITGSWEGEEMHEITFLMNL